MTKDIFKIIVTFKSGVMREKLSFFAVTELWEKIKEKKIHQSTQLFKNNILIDTITF